MVDLMMDELYHYSLDVCSCSLSRCRLLSYGGGGVRYGWHLPHSIVP